MKKTYPLCKKSIPKKNDAKTDLGFGFLHPKTIRLSSIPDKFH